MAQKSKNARVGVSAQKFLCSCGGEVRMKSVFQSGRMRHLAVCDQCNRQERRPSDF